jgi:hypothetical protein
MMKALNMGFFGLAMGVLGAVALPAQEAEAQVCTPTGCSHQAPPSPERYIICGVQRTACKASANGNTATLLMCEMQYAQCLRN